MTDKRGNKFILCVIFTSILLLTCDRDNEMNNKSQTLDIICNSNKISYKKLSDKKIFFGHMSVGYNIMDGIKDNIYNNKDFFYLNIIESANPDDFKSPVFAHYSIGHNSKPELKIDTFKNLMDNDLGNKIDIAFVKLCYVDIYDETDVNHLFIYYKTKIAQLIKKYPKTKFIHFTIPLTIDNMNRSIKTMLKDIVKRIIGRTTSKDRNIIENMKRNKYNDLIRKEFKQNEIFDIAAIESTYSDGKMEVHNYNGEDYYTLIPDYTDDGGHLNAKGRCIVAAGLLNFLSDL